MLAVFPDSKPLQDIGWLTYYNKVKNMTFDFVFWFTVGIWVTDWRNALINDISLLKHNKKMNKARNE